MTSQSGLGMVPWKEKGRGGEGRKGRGRGRKIRERGSSGRFKWFQSWSHSLSAECLHLEHEVSISGVVTSLRKKVCEILTVDQLHVKVFQHSVRWSENECEGVRV